MSFSDVFKVFDSHSLDLYDRPCALGYCVLISLEGLENIAEHLRLTSKSTETNIVVPFELKGVKCIINDDMDTGLNMKDTANTSNADTAEQFEQSNINSEEVDSKRNIQTSKKRLLRKEKVDLPLTVMLKQLGDEMRLLSKEKVDFSLTVTLKKPEDKMKLLSKEKVDFSLTVILKKLGDKMRLLWKGKIDLPLTLMLKR